MKALNKLSMIVIASSVLAGCGDSDSKAENATATESQTPTAQVQQVEKKVEKAAPALSTSLSHCIHNPVENHGAAPFHTFSDFSTSSPAPTTNTTTSSI